MFAEEDLAQTELWQGNFTYAIPIPFNSLSKAFARFVTHVSAFLGLFPVTLSFFCPDKSRASSLSEWKTFVPYTCKKGPTEVPTAFPPLFFRNIFARRKKNSPRGLFFYKYSQTLFSKEEPRYGGDFRLIFDQNVGFERVKIR
ncbi:hypothetical protein CEXT_355871 [Caerostris extrusa]|uniref:Uncharacterized protein n=1 Tax=Caerostris extrusa TaxID=172846 RepID=A0AAV4PPL1_CAEEX|nr:hypothetical protein CEXT_355871 [Caerostris extrusa]